MAYLSLSLLGPFKAWTANGVAQSFRTLKERALLSYLAVEHDQVHRREALAELLWPDRPEGISRNNLRQAFYGLRQAIGEPGFSTLFTLTADDVRFNVSDQMWLDLAAYEIHIKAAQMHSHLKTNPCPSCLQHLKNAVELYRGAFLEDLFLDKNQEFQEWVTFRREQYFRLQYDSMEFLISEYEASGEYVQAAIYAKQQVALDGLKDALVRRLMILLARTGQPSAALEQYEIFQRKHREVLGTPPEPQTIQTADEIRFGRMELFPSASEEPVHNLPEQLTPFVGREMELAQIAHYLRNPSCRLITLIGPGGVGKTRLAIQAALLHMKAYPNGIYFVALDHIQSVERLAEVIGTTLGLMPGGLQDMRSSLLELLRPKHVLLILDNFEHLLEGKELILDILKSAPYVRMMVTSRERINYQSEFILEINGLPYPEQSGGSATFDDQAVPEDPQMNHFAAVQLFIERASRVRPEMMHPEDISQSLRVAEPAELPEIIRICHLVGGLPLGIELAASWSRHYSFKQIADEIQRSLDFLQTSLADVPARHRNLRASFEHSWELLNESEREVLCRLSVFPDSFSIAAAEEICGAALPWLVRLEDKSLVRRVMFGRYTLHPLIRQFASQKLRQHSRRVEDQTREAHANYFCNFVREREAGLKGGRQASSLSEMDLELENIRVAWTWAIDNQAVNRLDQSANGLMLFLEMRSRWREGADYFARAARLLEMRQPNAGQERVLAVMLAYHGWFLCRLSQFNESEAMILKSIASIQGHEYLYIQTFAHFALGFLYTWMSRYPEAWENLKISHELAVLAGNEWALAWSQESMLEIAFESGKAGYQPQPFLDVLAAFERMGDMRGGSRSLVYLGNLAFTQGKYQEARAYFERMLANLEMLGDVWGAAGGYGKLGQVAAVSGDYHTAATLYKKELGLIEKTGDQRRMAYALGELGEALGQLADYAKAEKHFFEALATVRTTQNLLLAEDILCRIAAVFLSSGQSGPARGLLKLVLANPSGDPLTLNRAHRLVEHCGDSTEPRYDQVDLPNQWAGTWDAVESFLIGGIHFQD